jgi:hypothetical protein
MASPHRLMAGCLSLAAVDGRLWVLLFAFVVPGVLLIVTVVRFASNPLAVLAIFAAMLLGALYYTTYVDSSADAA